MVAFFCHDATFFNFKWFNLSQKRSGWLCIWKYIRFQNRFFSPPGGSNGSDDETPFNDNVSVVSNVSSGSVARDDCANSGDDTTEEVSQVSSASSAAPVCSG